MAYKITSCKVCNLDGSLCSECYNEYFLSTDFTRCTTCDPGECGTPDKQCLANLITNCEKCNIGATPCTKCLTPKILTVDGLQCVDTCPTSTCA